MRAGGVSPPQSWRRIRIAHVFAIRESLIDGCNVHPLFSGAGATRPRHIPESFGRESRVTDSQQDFSSTAGLFGCGDRVGDLGQREHLPHFRSENSVTNEFADLSHEPQFR